MNELDVFLAANGIDPAEFVRNARRKGAAIDEQIAAGWLKLAWRCSTMDARWDRKRDARTKHRPKATRKADRPRCGAMTRAGHACKARAVWDRERDRARNGRCRLHGGLSTGARTTAGKERARQAVTRRWARWRGERAL